MSTSAHHGKIVELLIAEGLITALDSARSSQRQVRRALCMQFNIEFLELSPVLLDATAVP